MVERRAGKRGAPVRAISRQSGRVRFLVDVQAPAEFLRQLAALGHHVESVYEHGLAGEKDDARLIAYAQARGFVFVTFDDFKGDQGQRVIYQLKHHGGKVVHIGGGPEQPVERALGKMLFHWAEWFPFLATHDGKVDLHAVKNPCRMTSKTEMKAEGVAVSKARHFDEYLDRLEEAKHRPLPQRPRRHDPRQVPMYLAEETGKRDRGKQQPAPSPVLVEDAESGV